MALNVHSFPPDSLPTVSDAIFERRGDALCATELARGPWDPNAQHGGAPAALLMRRVRAARAAAAPADRARHLRAAAARCRSASCTSARESSGPAGACSCSRRRSSTPDGTEVVRARARARRPRPAGRGHAGRGDCRADPEDARRHAPAPWGADALPGGAIEIRFAEGALRRAGPGAPPGSASRVPVVAGEQPSPLQRLLAAADFPNGISSELVVGRVAVHQPRPDGLHRARAGRRVDRAPGADPHHRGRVGVAQAMLFDARAASAARCSRSTSPRRAG